MKTKTIEFDSSKQSISDLIDEIANSIKESFDKSKSNMFKNMIVDTKQFINWVKDYKEIDDLLHQNIIIALNNLKKVDKKDIEHLNGDELSDYYDVVSDIEIVVRNYTYNICKQIRGFINEIIDERNKKYNNSYCKFTKEDLSKLCKEDLINMIINEEEPKRTKIEIIAIIQLLYIIVCLLIVFNLFYYRCS
jgi:hypothetical protein